MIKAKKKYDFKPDYAVPPGETLKEVMQSLDMTRKELSQRTGLTIQSIIRILKGEQPITYETAGKLEMATGVPSRMWNNLESLYREQLEKIEQKKRLAVDLGWLEKIPTKELITRGFIQPQKDEVSLLRETLKFFGAGSVAAWSAIWENPAVTARRSRSVETLIGPASAWIRMGEIEAHEINCRPFDKATFRKAVWQIRSLTVKDPQDFIPQMKKLCAESGVVLSLIPEMKKVPWYGASKWLAPHKALIILNLRGKYEDQFWFSFFHETGHILNDNKKHLYINEGPHGDEIERKADDFAVSILFTNKQRHEIPQLKSYPQVKTFAKELGVSPGIVAGQYQHMTQKWGWFNKVRKKFRWN